MNIGDFLGFIFSVGFFVFILVIGWYVLQAIAYWLVFVKAGESGWKSLIPIYNTYIQFKISWNTNMFFLALICGIIAVFFGSSDGFMSYVAALCALVELLISYGSSYKLSRAFGHGILFALGLLFLQPIFLLILGFGSSTYQGPQ